MPYGQNSSSYGRGFWPLKATFNNFQSFVYVLRTWTHIIDCANNTYNSYWCANHLSIFNDMIDLSSWFTMMELVNFLNMFSTEYCLLASIIRNLPTQRGSKGTRSALKTNYSQVKTIHLYYVIITLVRNLPL